ncbi:MAG: T9SS type A sorting domain-containing protein [Candidatus Krumholzibacteriota bacterium]|nr:T9SS type A sorting domain-containing protein [Candidatus Krumholzibacteriota bacterium]
MSDKEVAPHKYHVYQSYPNPFNPVCTIRYEMPVSGRMSIRIYDVEGRLIRNLADKFRKPGVYSEVWNGKSDNGRGVASGVYFYQFKVNDFKKTGKMILMR